MEPTDPPNIESFELVVDDDARFRVRWFSSPPCAGEPSRRTAATGDGTATASGPVVVLSPAMGVEASYYERLLAALAAEGIPCLGADLRGLGGSSLRAGWGTDFGYRETVETDLPAFVAEARRRAPGRPVVILGHSLGGQLACLAAACRPGLVDGLLLVSTCSVHFRGWRGLVRWGLAAFQGLAYASSRVLGFFPGRTIGFGGRESRGVIADWAFQGFTGRYRLRASGCDPEAALGELEVPLRIVNYADDTYCPPAAVSHLLEKMPRARIERIRRSPQEVGAARVGHFSWARRPAVLLPDVLPWLRSLAPGVRRPGRSCPSRSTSAT